MNYILYTFLNFFLKDPCNYLKSIVYYTSATKQRFHSQVGKAEDCNSSIIGSSPVGTSIRVPWWRNWYELSPGKKNKNIFSVTVLDIDKFKRINDSFGHVFGNKILFKIAKTINKMFKNTPYSYGRFGGDEFLIVSSNCNIGEYKVKLNNLLEKISNIKVDDLNHIKLSMSSGTHYVDFANNNISDSFEDAIAFADKKMYLAKANKK